MIRFFIKIALFLLPCLGFSQANDPGFVRISMDTIANEFYYDYNYQQDSTDSGSEKYQEMVLQVGKRHSKFTSVNKLLKDSLMIAFKDLSLRLAVTKVASGIKGSSTGILCQYYVYKDQPNIGQVNFIGDLDSKTSLSVIETPSFNWKHIKGDTTILSYACQKAICSYGGRDYIAWYTPEIPISDGPYKFLGLPGLIVRIADTHKEHIFQLYKVKNSRNNREMFFIEDNYLSETTAKGFTKAFKRYVNSLYMKYGGNPNLQHSSPDGESRMLRNIRATNNFIERY
ncbi:GLPGLI family protein [Ancylomarina euxinus]|uniref:GLPGLI family protein n=1 Tax=Ancylomarina euxinus TaxID=2283627 RepID=A0A425Y7M8_9BACT|nr:GLPGLI family protein [Ancylomarina euxinus]MCZ4693656.1 GLPGLI family protein [Ancylomarina euxinus]MUP13885.1 GLPGLI family protein [Ancylomarina euxinus]RRG24486.1 GLPGLI family protein [Ancylomarina euxinus]